MISLRFVSGGQSSLGSLLIEWYDHGKYSHVDSVLPDGTLLGARNDVIGSVPAGVQIRPANYTGSEAFLVVNIPCEDTQEAVFYQFLKSQIGKPYDQTAIAAFVVGRNWSDPSAWFCSELCAAGLEHAGVVHSLSAPVNKIAPDDLLLVVSALTTI